jgi:hypothetical protein
MTTSTSTPAASSSAASSYFDLHTFALGYIEDIREIQVRKGGFLACRFSAVRSGDDNGTSRFDLKVVGAHAKSCVMALKPLTDANKSVLVQIKLGDVYPEQFQYKSGNRAGEFGVNIKGRMLKMYGATADGQAVELPAMPYSSDAKAPPSGLVTRGVGYLNRVVRKPLGEGDYVWMASVAALRGDPVDGGKVETTRFVLAVGPEALESTIALQDAILAKKKVLIGFDALNIRAELFEYQSGEKKGQTGSMLKGALTRLSWAKVDGEQFPLTVAEKAA